MDTGDAATDAVEVTVKHPLKLKLPRTAEERRKRSVLWFIGKTVFFLQVPPALPVLQLLRAQIRLLVLPVLRPLRTPKPSGAKRPQLTTRVVRGSGSC
jgi:hypothetical protein